MTRLREPMTVLAVQDLQATTAYFRDSLGFTVRWEVADDWRMLARDEIRFMIGHCPSERSARDIGDHSYVVYIHTDDVNALHQEFAANDAIILQPPADKPWGLREMLIGTPDGHRLMFGQALSYAAVPLVWWF